jgi:hypothetical protein
VTKVGAKRRNLIDWILEQNCFSTLFLQLDDGFKDGIMSRLILTQFGPT